MDGGWMDGWMEGGWMDGWMDGWVGGWIDGWMDGWMVNKEMDLTLVISSDLERRNVDVEEKKYLLDTGVVTETQINMG